MRVYRFAITSLSTLALLASVSCSSSDDVESGDLQLLAKGAAAAGNSAKRGPDPSPSGDAGAAPSGHADVPATPVSNDAGVVLCGKTPCQCNNGIDDDGDGVVDGFDSECTGALDDDEATFATGIPGDNRDPKWQDCFFDGNSGAGDDRCRYPTECLTGELPEDAAACATTEACRNNCLPLTPNGCDCFGCCAVTLPSGQALNITLSGSCSLLDIGDPEACPRCTPSVSCQNPCGECELCPGKSAADLPAHCGEGDPKPPADDPGGEPNLEPPAVPAEPPAPTPACEGGTTCTATAGCSFNEFCSFGCCLAVIR
jgi:hypothetical protein